jgi:hypothetical protein
MISQKRETLTPAQLAAVQTLYSQWVAHTMEDTVDPRATRLAWASNATGREIFSFKQLTSDEARRLIDVLKVSMGQPVNERVHYRGRIRSRELANAAGTAGRRGAQSKTIYLASVDDLTRIESAIKRLGWTHEELENWLRSPSSPIGRRANPEIRTLADANRVWWALKAMLRHAGLWRSDDEKRFVPLRAAREDTTGRTGPAA